MKTLNKILKDFSGVTPIFPLPEFVFFPKTVQPFHIFEPRYLDMLRDIEAGEGLVTITLIKGDASAEQPEIHEIATLGYLHQSQKLEDGSQNVLITGLVKVRIDEVESIFAYRRGAITILSDFDKVTDAGLKMNVLLRKFEAILEQSAMEHNIKVLADENLPVEMLTHMIIMALPINAGEKQKLLELQSLELRIDILNNFLESGLGTLTKISPFDPIVPSNPLWN